jgi:glycosyltransferase involved in cell wall biosynthesis
MKKICHITSVHPSNDIRIFVKECSSLAAAGFDVTLVVANAKTEEANGVKIVGVESVTGSRATRMLKTVKKVYKAALKVDADIYHFHDPELLRIALKLKKRGKKVIYDAHEDVPKQIMGKGWIPKPFRKIVSGTFRRYENRIARKLDYIFTATPAIRDRFIKINSNSIDINNYPILGELASGENKSENSTEICYIGGITSIRGLMQLVQALEQTGENVSLNLAGILSSESFKEELEALSGWQKVNHLGMVDRPTVAKIMARSVCGIVTFLRMPNHVDAQPNKMFEYMSAGLPVIGSDFPLWKEVIEKNNCGICVNPEDPKQIAEAINYIIEHPLEAQKMGANGVEAVNTKYNWDAEKKKLIEIYNNL